MNILSAIILGLVEGISEFLPVSSTFHLIFASKILAIPSSDFVKLFEVVIQSGAILSVFILYLGAIRKNPVLVQKVFLSFLPTALIGFILYKAIKEIFFESQMLMLFVFIGTGMLFILVEYLVKTSLLKSHGILRLPTAKAGVAQDDIVEISYKDALIIGLMQSLAVVPGVSRAGIVIVAALLLGYKRDQAAYYSFLLAIPTIFAAGAYDLYKSRDIIFASGSTENLLFLAIGFAAACISAYFVMKWLIGFLSKNTLVWFGVYRIIIGLGLIFFL